MNTLASLVVVLFILNAVNAFLDPCSVSLDIIHDDIAAANTVITNEISKEKEKWVNVVFLEKKQL